MGNRLKRLLVQTEGNLVGYCNQVYKIRETSDAHLPNACYGYCQVSHEDFYGQDPVWEDLAIP